MFGVGVARCPHKRHPHIQYTHTTTILKLVIFILPLRRIFQILSNVLDVRGLVNTKWPANDILFDFVVTNLVTVAILVKESSWTFSLFQRLFIVGKRKIDSMSEGCSGFVVPWYQENCGSHNYASASQIICRCNQSCQVIFHEFFLRLLVHLTHVSLIDVYGFMELSDEAFKKRFSTTALRSLLTRKRRTQQSLQVR